MIIQTRRQLYLPFQIKFITTLFGTSGKNVRAQKDVILVLHLKSELFDGRGVGGRTGKG